MTANLLIEVRLHDGRYHGRGEAEPSPGRLFQALVAGAARSRLALDWRASLRWLEGLAPPIVALPHFEEGPLLKTFVPNNDLDTVNGDVRRLPELRVPKERALRCFDPAVPLLFAWQYEEAQQSSAVELCQIAEQLYQFGRGIDPAYAKGSCLDDASLAERLHAYPGRVLYPGALAGRDALRAPTRGTLDSLEVRYLAFRERLRRVDEGRRPKEELRQPPPARFTSVSYGGRPAVRVYALVHEGRDETAALPITAAQSLCVAVRDAAVAKLTAALPGLGAQIDAALVGRRKGGGNDAPAAQRIRIFPLPSIGHEEADRRVRRVAVVVPDSSPLEEADVWWAFSNAKVELDRSVVRLLPAWEDTMLRHYARRDSSACAWRSVTPLALPESAARRRIEPSRTKEEAKSGSERQREEDAAGAAVLQALRHAGVNVPVVTLSVRRHAYDKRGERAEKFATSERFKKERVWHAEIHFARPVEGPLAVGDGRFLGLGLLAPLANHGRHAFEIVGGMEEGAVAEDLARALRRAVMARAQAVLGPRRDLPTYFSGHGHAGEKAAGHGHLRYICDLPRRRLLVLDDDGTTELRFSEARQGHRDTLARALAGLRELRAGKSGLLALRPCPLDESGDPLFAKGKVWRSVTPFSVTRHSKKVSVEESIRRSVLDECKRKRLPAPSVAISKAVAISGRGHLGEVTLSFPVGVCGPLMLGRSEHAGGGLFERL